MPINYDQEILNFSTQKDDQLKTLIRRNIIRDRNVREPGPILDRQVEKVFNAIKRGNAEQLSDPNFYPGEQGVPPGFYRATLEEIGGSQGYLQKRNEEERQLNEQLQKQIEDEESKKLEFERSVQEETRKRSQAELAKRLEDIFGRVEKSGIERIEQQFIPARKKLISEEAALGRLRSPVSIIPLSRLEEQKQLSLSQLIGNLAAQRASGELDVSKTIEGLLSAEKEAERRGKEFGQELGLRRQTLSEQIRQFNEENAIRRQLGFEGLAVERSKLDKIGQRDLLSDIVSATEIAKSLLGTKTKGRGGIFL